MQYALACLSDAGVAREWNEDNFAFFGKLMPVKHKSSVTYFEEKPANSSFAVGVFDGMGGGTDGENASYVAAKAFEENATHHRWSRDNILELFNALEIAVCIERDVRRAKTMGTTATILAINNDHAYIGNVGDSPAMLYADGELQRVSCEHTDAETLRILGITGKKSGLTQFLGMSDEEIVISPHIADFDIFPGNAILLASDGLTGSLDTDSIRYALASEDSIAEKVKLLRDLAVQAGGIDNITVLLCEASEPESTHQAVIT